jgi:phasin family protein
MFAIPEQFSTASKANLEAQLTLVTDLASKTFESVEKVIDLNVNAAKASLEESGATARQFLAAKGAQEWLALSAAQAQPTAEKTLAYGRHLAGIVSGLQAEFSKAAEEQLAQTSRKVLDLIDEVSKNAPAGSENAVALVKSAIGNVNAGYEQLSKTTKQTVDTLEANLTAAVSQFADAAAAKTARAAGAKK